MLPLVCAWYPQSTTGLLGAESIWCKACLELHACLSSEWHSGNIPIFKSSSGEERQIWECLERRGGRVDHPDQLRDGSNAVAAASPGAAWPCTDGCRNKRYPLGLSKTLSPSQSNLPHEQGVKCIALQGSSKPETRPPLKGGLWRRA